MGDWTISSYVVDTDSASDFPMALFMGYNDGISINFTLTSVPDDDVIARIATTLSFAGGRPQMTLNSNACDAPDAPTKIDSRGVTRGAYRGYGEVYNCTWSSDTLVEGDNSLVIDVLSGSTGDAFLSPNFVSACTEKSVIYERID
jgi:rhamnogalacturonan endolyase